MSKVGQLSVFIKPQCLIKTDDEGKLHVEEKIISEISTIKESLVVVAIAGLYRTGKSFLMNRLTNTESGFPVGQTTEAKTKGIWIFCRSHPTQDNTVLVLLDTEGLGDIKKGDVNHDNKILTLTVLLCNVLCYNILNVFDEDAAERLAFISSSIGQQQNEFSPDLILCIRDFSLELNGKTEEEYLEDSLKSLEGNSEKVQKYNMSRSCIRKSFPRRMCFTFDRPAERTDLKRLDKLTKTSFSPDFMEDVRKYEKYLYERRPKSVYGVTTLDGFMLTSVTRCHIESVNSGMVPEVQDALQKACEQANEKQVINFDEKFRRELNDIKLPVLSFIKFEELCNSKAERLLTDLKQHLRCDDNKIFKKKAREQMAKIKDEIWQNNFELVDAHCTGKLFQLFSTVVGFEHKYNRIGGHENYRSAIKSFKAYYRFHCSEADQKLRERALQRFLDEKTEIESRIMTEDRRLTKEKEDRQKEQMRLEHERQRQESIRRYEERQREEEAMRERERMKQEEFYRAQEQNRRRIEKQARRDNARYQRQINRLKEENRDDRENWRRQMEDLGGNRNREGYTSTFVFYGDGGGGGGNDGNDDNYYDDYDAYCDSDDWCY
ncbi:guanylate-binding protein 5-like isoform X1 [Mercenaria mercenaria]|uniref:guanylate-binding protein 5-like isoform X1 n=1 Tax=Mercenaria mercenaria TaxID=6596 RepID=UPI00234E9A03|nr:guanylate-binding protein 5-like isoform X1 [Mercenaria mercenaria]